MFFDGSDVGVTKNVSAFAILPNGDILLAFGANQTLAGLGIFTAFDVARFHPTSTGAVTAGTSAWYIDGSDIGLTTAGEKIDALDVLGDGRVLISTAGVVTVPGLANAQDEDVLVFSPTATGASTAGSWMPPLYLDGSTVAGLGVEDVNGFWADEVTGARYVTILGGFTLGGVTGADKSIVKLMPTGGSPPYTPSLVEWAVPPFNVDGLEMTR